jgi:hypothetical protein
MAVEGLDLGVREDRFERESARPDDRLHGVRHGRKAKTACGAKMCSGSRPWCTNMVSPLDVSPNESFEPASVASRS